MDKQILIDTAKALLSPGMGILAADGSVPTVTKRFEKLGIESTEETRRKYREIVLTTEGIEDFISGVILFDETFRQKIGDKTFPEFLVDRGIIPGIKVDKQAWPFPNFPNEKITEGLDGLHDRLVEYKSLGARFAKWRAIITIGEGIPTNVCIDSNAEAMARYAALCQEVDILPIVEPETLMDGDHDLNRCAEVTYSALKKTFTKLVEHKVYLEGVILKVNMVVPGKESTKEVSDEEIADTTLRILKESVPSEVPGIVFLSGGQSADDATRRLDIIIKRSDSPWGISFSHVGFSYDRSLQGEALDIWQGKEENIPQAQKQFHERARLVALARSGKLT